MKHYTIVWRPKARNNLFALYDWIAQRADPETAFDYTSRIEAHVAKLAEFPERGTPRDDLSPGLRTLAYRRRTVIAYRVNENVVEVLGLIHSGQDWGGDGFG